MEQIFIATENLIRRGWEEGEGRVVPRPCLLGPPRCWAKTALLLLSIVNTVVTEESDSWILFPQS
jgi:hypothetical protein